MSRVTLRSQAVAMDKDQKVVQEAVISDLQNIALELDRRKVVQLVGGDRVVVPTAGVCKVYASSAVTTTGSDGSNYFVVKALRNGQDESGVDRDTRDAEILGYEEFYLGTFAAGKGDEVYLSVTMTGTLYPLLTNMNLSLRVELGPQAIIR